MIGLDTNVLVRYIMQDDAKQARQAATLIESLTPQRPGFISVVALVELVWVLESVYALTRAQIVQALQTLLNIELRRPSLPPPRIAYRARLRLNQNHAAGLCCVTIKGHRALASRIRADPFDDSVGKLRLTVGVATQGRRHGDRLFDRPDFNAE